MDWRSTSWSWSRAALDAGGVQDGREGTIEGAAEIRRNATTQVRLQLVHEKKPYRRQYPAFGVTVIDYESFSPGSCRLRGCARLYRTKACHPFLASGTSGHVFSKTP